MSLYRKHIFFCTNQKSTGRKCCADADAVHMCAYAKQRLRALDMWGKGKVRVSSSGCLGRCSVGPCVVIYPEGIWYTYASQHDVDEIIEQHILGGKIVTRLLLPLPSEFVDGTR